MNVIRKSVNLLLLYCLILLTSACDKAYQKDQKGSQQNVNPLIHQRYVEPFIKCIEYYYKMVMIMRNNNSDKIFDYMRNPILAESQNTNIFELNTLYPDLGTEFYAKLITGVKMMEKATWAHAFGQLGLFLNKGDLSEEIRIKKEYFPEEALLLEWNAWWAENADKIINVIKDNYDSIDLTYLLNNNEILN